MSNASAAKAVSDAEKALAVFMEYDTDGNGQISRDELSTVLRHLLPNVTSAQIDKLFKAVDLNGDGEISYDEFVMGLFLEDGAGTKDSLHRKIDQTKVADEDGVSDDDEEESASSTFCRKNTTCITTLAEKARLDFANANLVEPIDAYRVHNSIISAFGGLRHGEKFCNDKRAIVRTELQNEVVESDDVYTWSGLPALKGACGVGVMCQKGQKGADDPTPNQDNYFICHIGAVAIYAAVDGHGPFGHLVSFRVVQALLHNIVKNPHFGADWERCLREAFRQTQEAVLNLSIKDAVNIDASGAAASVAVFDGPCVHVAHIGDARVLIGSWSKKDSRVIYISEDHKPELAAEKARIEAAGMEVRGDPESGTRIYLPGQGFPGLTMSRAFGDTASKGVLQEPDYKMLEVGADAEIFAILASDGVWEFMNPNEMIEFTTKKLRLRGPAGTAAYLVDFARKLWKHHCGDYCDDITAVVVMRNMARKGIEGDHRFSVRPYREAENSK